MLFGSFIPLIKAFHCVLLTMRQLNNLEPGCFPAAENNFVTAVENINLNHGVLFFRAADRQGKEKVLFLLHK